MTQVFALVQIHPLFAILTTVAAYAVAMAAWYRLGRPTIMHPVLIATALLSLMLLMTGISYASYMSQAAFLNEALAIIIVLLAVPLSRQLQLILDAGWPIAIALMAGSTVAILTALALPVASGAADELLAALAPKSATAAVAVEISSGFGGAAGLTAVIVISTGIFGGVAGPAILEIVGVEDERAKGFALGVASHAIGTARAFQISEIAGAFASLGMILNALLTVALAPFAMGILG